MTKERTYIRILITILLFSTITIAVSPNVLEITMNENEIYHTTITVEAQNFTSSYSGDLADKIHVVQQPVNGTQVILVVIEKPPPGNFFGVISVSYDTTTYEIPMIIEVLSTEEPSHPHFSVSEEALHLAMDINETQHFHLKVKNDGNVDLTNFHADILYNCSWLSVSCENKTLEVGDSRYVFITVNTTGLERENKYNKIFLVTNEYETSVMVSLSMVESYRMRYWKALSNITELQSKYNNLVEEYNLLKTQYEELQLSVSQTLGQEGIQKNISQISAQQKNIQKNMTELLTLLQNLNNSINNRISSLSDSIDGLMKNISNNVIKLEENINIIDYKTVETQAKIQELIEKNEEEGEKKDISFIGLFFIIVVVFIALKKTQKLEKISSLINLTKTEVSKNGEKDKH